MNFLVARAVLVPSLILVRPPALAVRAPLAPVAVRLSATLAGGGASKRASRRKRFEGRANASSAPTIASSTIEILSALDEEASVADRLDRFTRLNQPHKVLQLYNATAESEQRTVLPLVMRSLLKMRSVEAAMELQRRHAPGGGVPLDTRSACSLFLAACRTGRLEAARSLCRWRGAQLAAFL